jgi:hypothetical protein
VRGARREAVRVLRELGFAVHEPDLESVPENLSALTCW